MIRTLIYLLLILPALLCGQGVNVQGYTYAANNSGYIGAAEISISADGVAMPGVFLTDKDGKFNVQLPAGKKYEVTAQKSGFADYKLPFTTEGKANGEWVYLKLPMDRLPGYVLEALLSETTSRILESDTIGGKGPAANAIEGATIEIYNNTHHREELRLVNHPTNQFTFRLEQGNEYTLLIRKKGYFNKRAVIKVNIKGCILCCEGLGTITPGIVDNLTREFTMGTLGANVTLKPIIKGESIKLENIFYEEGRWDLRSEARESLKNLVKIMKENPQLVIELSSHTDCRGAAADNLSLSDKRAKSAVEYITKKGIAATRLRAKGYGETRLVNKCKDGVSCSEEQHAQNRRTEFAVVDMVEDPYEGRSLRSIMMDEELEEILVANDTFYYEAPVVAEVPPVKEAAKPAEKPLVITDVKPEEPEFDPATYEEPAPVVKEEPKQVPVEQPVTSIVTETSKPAPPKPAEILATRKARPVPMDQDCYRIEVYNRAEEIPDTDNLYSEFGNITKGLADNGNVSYMVGAFDKRKNAQDFMQKNIITRYPAARIVAYKAGQRIE